jgi:hypothetical protein
MNRRNLYDRCLSPNEIIEEIRSYRDHRFIKGKVPRPVMMTDRSKMRWNMIRRLYNLNHKCKIMNKIFLIRNNRTNTKLLLNSQFRFKIRRQ